MKVLFLSRIDEEAISYLKGKIETEVRFDLGEGEISEIVGDFHALIVRSKPKIGKEILKRAKNLKVIGRAGVGLDNIDLDFCRDNKIEVINTPKALTESVAEHVFALLLSFARGIPKADSGMREGKWLKKELRGSELCGKILGVLGFGRIGFRISEIAKCFGMRVLAHDVIDIREVARKVSADVVSFEELLRRSDFVSLHVPLLSSTKDLISERELKMMKNSAVLINTSRGAVVNEDALLNALRRGEIAGACLDVFSKEPPKNSKLLELENVILTPHIASNTKEAQKRTGMECVQKVLEVLEGKNDIFNRCI
ncbi:MAG: hydroxyacid dehydrogenase [Candidatus Methanofastidiosia archaeon]